MAANPIEVTCLADVWTLVATGVTTAEIHKTSTSPNVYKMVTRVSLGAAPTTDEGAWLAFDGSNSEEISDSGAIDVYLKAVRVDGLVSAVL